MTSTRESTPDRTHRNSGVRRTIVVAGAAVAVVALIVGLWAFQPWRLFTSRTVDESLPTAAGPAAPASSTAAPSQPAGSTPSLPAVPAVPAPNPPAAPPRLTVLAQGEFVTQEHPTSGVAKVIELGDGSRVLRLEGFSTSDGPDLHVWLTDQPAGGDWKSYDDGRYVRLGGLKGTDGNQNYPIPADADLTGLRSVVIWCDRFNVAFGSAELPL